MNGYLTIFHYLSSKCHDVGKCTVVAILESFREEAEPDVWKKNRY